MSACFTAGFGLSGFVVLLTGFFDIVFHFPFCSLAALISLPLLLHLRQNPFPVASVAPEVVNQNHVLAVGFGHELDDATMSESQSLRGEKVNSGEAGPATSAGQRWPRLRAALVWQPPRPDGEVVCNCRHTAELGKLRGTAGCGPACQVVGEPERATFPTT